MSKKNYTSFMNNVGLIRFLLENKLSFKLDYEYNCFNKEYDYRLTLIDGNGNVGVCSGCYLRSIGYNLEKCCDDLINYVTGKTVKFGDKEVVFPIIIKE